MARYLLIMILCSNILISKDLGKSINFENSNQTAAFIENKGQWDSDILYASNWKNQNIVIKERSIVFDFFVDEDETRQGQVISINFNTDNEIDQLALKPLKHKTNYFKGNDPSKWASNVNSYEAVILKNVFPEIDVVVYFENGSPRYDFGLRIGANPNDISFSIDGADQVETDPEEGLVIHTKLGKIYNGDILAYQHISGQRQEVDCEIVKNQNTYSFKLGDYSPNHPLVIDPLIYSSYFGGNSKDNIKVLYPVDETSFVACGWTESEDFYTTPGAYTEQHKFAQDGFITKFRQIGAEMEIVFSTIIGTGNIDYLEDVHVDEEGSIYTCGATNGVDFPVVANFGREHAGEFDAVLVKLTPNGDDLEISGYYGGSKDDMAHALTINDDKEIFVVGETESRNLLLRGNPIQETNKGGIDAFLFSVNYSGNMLNNSTYYGGVYEDIPYDIATDGSGNLFIVGSTKSTDLPIHPWRKWGTNIWQSPYDPDHNGGWDGFAVQLSGNGSNFVYSGYFGGSADDFIHGVLLNDDDSIFLVGETVKEGYDPTFPVTDISYQRRHNGQIDGFLAHLNKITESGGGYWPKKEQQLLYSTFLGGPADDVISSITRNPKDNSLIVSGYTQSFNFPTKNTNTQHSGGFDAFIANFTSTGYDIVLSMLMGGNLDDFANTAFCNQEGDIYFAGYTLSTEQFEISDNAIQKEKASDQDAFLSKYATGQLFLTNPFGENQFCIGQDILIEWSINELTNDIIIEYKSTTDEEWTEIARVTDEESYEWTIPNTMSSEDEYYIRVSHPKGIYDILESPFTLSEPPVIESVGYSPEASGFCEGESVMFSVTATGDGIAYQWMFNDEEITGANESTYEIESLSIENHGTYKVKISGDCPPIIESETIDIVVAENTEITTQPATQEVVENESFTLEVESNGKELAYQWFRNDTELLGENSYQYYVESAQEADEGSYKCEVTGYCGSEISEVAEITVIPESSIFDNDLYDCNFVIEAANINNEELSLSVSSKQGCKLEIQIADLNGNILDTIYAGYINEGKSSFSTNISHYSSGTYILLGKCGNRITSRKIQIIK